VDDAILTMGEVAELLRMTEKQVYELCRRRSQERAKHPFPAFNIHVKAKRIRRSDLMAWIDTLAKQSDRGR
jgi:predicted DNA-binding transcriptional regulator AlpA